MLNLIPIEHNNQRVMLTAQLAEFYGTEPKIISKNFERNKDQYMPGEDYFVLQGKELKDFAIVNLTGANLSKIRSLYLWTEMGALLHAKSLNTEQAWKVYKELRKSYFVVQNSHKAQTTYIPWEGTDVMKRAILNEPYSHPGYFTILSILIELSKDIHMDLLGLASDSRMDISVSSWWSKYCKRHGINLEDTREQDYNIVNIDAMIEKEVYHYPNELRDTFKQALIHSYFAEGYFRKWAESVRKGNPRIMLPEEINRVEHLVTNPPTRAFLPKNNKWKRK